MKKKIFKLLTGMLLSCALAGSTVAVQALSSMSFFVTGKNCDIYIFLLCTAHSVRRVPRMM